LLKVGADCSLRVLGGGEGQLAYWLEEDGIVIGGATQAYRAADAGGVEWLAPRQGSMRRAATG
jgi:hypothetical protein